MPPGCSSHKGAVLVLLLFISVPTAPRGTWPVGGICTILQQELYNLHMAIQGRPTEWAVPNLRDADVLRVKLQQ
jgi:hypothetical protein